MAIDDSQAGGDGVTGPRRDPALAEFVGHRSSANLRTPVEEVYDSFRAHSYEFVAVLDGARFVGLCARREIGMLLGARYGFSLFARKPIVGHIMAECLVLTVDTPLARIFEQAFSRPEGSYYDDIVVVDESRNFVGLVFTRTLVRLQHEMLQRNIDQLTEKQREIRLKNEQIEEELRVAHRLQLALLPAEYSTFPPGAQPDQAALEFSYCYLPSGMVGGDFFHLQSISEHEIGVFLCDVMGHGVSAALVTAMLRTLVEELQPEASDPAALLKKINRELRALLKNTGGVLFVTAATLVIDTLEGEARYALAGHPPPVHLDRATGIAAALPCSRSSMGPGLGIFDDAQFTTSCHRLAEGDRMVLFTDGLFEVYSPESDEFGLTRFIELTQHTGDISGKDLPDVILAELRGFSRSHDFADDVCLVCMDVRSIGEAR